jgi:hypothetical protein
LEEELEMDLDHLVEESVEDSDLLVEELVDSLEDSDGKIKNISYPPIKISPPFPPKLVTKFTNRKRGHVFV